ncbi:MAG TPA: PDZ domain-containing protein, partial [Fimbriimonadaceae bacterium]|nr:PDZ domain-containing protein [Fimbriimonadaceae bacterium]
LPKQDEPVWQVAKNSVAMIMRQGVVTGEAVLIDKSGLFLANQSAISTPSVQARMADGTNIVLEWKATDVPTQTVLLQAEEWAPEHGTVVTLRPPATKLAKLPVLVVLPSGPVRGELVDGNVVGYLSSSKRSFPLGEVRFEASTQSVAGALLFDEAGHLVGLLNATLATQEPQSKFVHVAGPKHGDMLPLNGVGGGNGGQTRAANMNQFGPADFTTGYTVGPEVLRRVVSGFLSPSHKVLHPAIGIQCKYDPLTPGALITLVKDGSPAALAGIQVGDLIVRMDERPIKNQFDFAQVIEAKDVGDSLTITVMRFAASHTFKLTVGTIQKAQVISAPEIVRSGSGD